MNEPGGGWIDCAVNFDGCNFLGVEDGDEKSAQNERR
jgi:hypothetical protein